MVTLSYPNKVRPRPPIVYILVCHREALPCGIFPQQGALVLDALALTPVGVIAAQPQVQYRPIGGNTIMQAGRLLSFAACGRSQPPM